MEKSQIYLNTPIGSGGEANIYEVRFRPDLVAKICHKPNADYARKLQIMITNPPDDLLAARGLVSIVWAGGACDGFGADRWLCNAKAGSESG